MSRFGEEPYADKFRLWSKTNQKEELCLPVSVLPFLYFYLR
jgi:hypothetical protein